MQKVRFIQVLRGWNIKWSVFAPDTGSSWFVSRLYHQSFGVVADSRRATGRRRPWSGKALIFSTPAMPQRAGSTRPRGSAHPRSSAFRTGCGRRSRQSARHSAGGGRQSVSPVPAPANTPSRRRWRGRVSATRPDRHAPPTRTTLTAKARRSTRA